MGSCKLSVHNVAQKLYLCLSYIKGAVSLACEGTSASWPEETLGCRSW